MRQGICRVRRGVKKGDAAATISRAALAGTDKLAEQALDLFMAVYGQEAANLALKVMATGGLFLAGGISPKILAKLSVPYSCRLSWKRGGCGRWWNRFRFRLLPMIKRIAGGGALRRRPWQRTAGLSSDQWRERDSVSSAVEIRTFTTPQEISAAAAEEVVRAANEAVNRDGRFTLALSGGSTPRISTIYWPRMLARLCPGIECFFLGR